MSTHKRKRASPWIIFAILCFSALIVLAALYSSYSSVTRSVVPNPEGIEREESAEADSLFQLIDWEYWREVNPDIIAWVTVPATSIDYAVVQAPKSNPTYYLYHDIYRNKNPYGCPYVDADCEGITSLNTVIFGHNIRFGDTMFAEFTRFINRDFAAEHPLILLQTPDSKLTLKVSAVDIVRGTDPLNKTEFESTEAFQSWYADRFSASALQISNCEQETQLFTFVTCSYTYFSNERTLVYAQIETERTSL